MLSLIVGLLGYWMGPEMFGASLINAVESINILYWILGSILGVLGLVVVFMGTLGGGVGGADVGGKIGAVLGSVLGAGASVLLMTLAFIKIILMIYLTDYLAGSIDPSMSNLDGLTTTQVIAFVIVLVLPFTGGNSSSSKS